MHCCLRLYGKSLETHDPAFRLVHAYHVVLCPGARQLHPVYVDGPVTGCLHRVDDLFVLALEAGAFDLFYRVALDELLQVVCVYVSACYTS